LTADGESAGGNQVDVTREEFFRQALDPEVCFLCGRDALDEDRTREHVFPKWLLNRHDLWNQRLTLLNGETIPYRQLTITCCATCNNGVLAELEDEVGQAFAGGPDAVRALDPERLFLWLAKFYYGLLFRELSLVLDRRDPSAGMIVDEEMLKEYGLHHLLLRRLLGVVEWNEFPGSIFIFDALDHLDPAHTFDYFDAFDAPFVCLRSGRTFVVAFLQDFGAVHHLGVEQGPRCQAARAVELHPLQCAELMTVFSYTLKKRERAPKFVVAQQPGDSYMVMVLPQGGLSGRSPFGEWNEDDYFALLESFFERRFGIELGVTEDHRPTFLLSSEMKPVQAPSADWYPEVWDDPVVLERRDSL
jgi:hypothetical protein